MTMMAPTEEDAMFELELRILPQDGKDRYSLNGAYTQEECAVHASAVTEGCTTTSNCTITCYTRFAPESATPLAPTMCNT